MVLRPELPRGSLLRILFWSFLALGCANSRASGTGPGDEGTVEAWDWCMQENVKAAVWAGDAPETAVQGAYKDCRPEFKAVLDALPDEPKRAALRQRAAGDRPMLMGFAKKMKKLGNPNN